MCARRSTQLSMPSDGDHSPLTMKRSLVIDESSGATWPPRLKRLRPAVVTLRPSDDGALGLLADVWFAHIFPSLIESGYACRTLVMLRRTTRWLAHHVIAPNISEDDDDGRDWLDLYNIESHTFLFDGHVAALGWRIKVPPRLARFNEVQDGLLYLSLMQNNIEAFFSICRSAFVRPSESTTRRAIRMGSPTILLHCLVNGQNVPASMSVFLQDAIDQKAWPLAELLARRVDRRDSAECIRGLPARFIQSLTDAITESPLALSAAVEVQNYVLRYAKLDAAPSYEDYNAPFIRLAAAIHAHTEDLGSGFMRT
jgi:hypothetical protein